MNKRMREERNLDIVDLAQKLLIAKIQSTGQIGTWNTKLFYDCAKEFVDYGLENYPTTIEE